MRAQLMVVGWLERRRLRRRCELEERRRPLLREQRRVPLRGLLVRRRVRVLLSVRELAVVEMGMRLRVTPAPCGASGGERRGVEEEHGRGRGGRVEVDVRPRARSRYRCG